MTDPASPHSKTHFVPYQAYKPKRHSRNFSNPNPRLTPSASESSPPFSPPPSTVVSPTAPPTQRIDLDQGKEKLYDKNVHILPSGSDVGPSGNVGAVVAVASPSPTDNTREAVTALLTQTIESSKSLLPLSPRNEGNEVDIKDEITRPRSAFTTRQPKELVMSSPPPCSSPPSSSSGSAVVPQTRKSRTSSPKKPSTFRHLPQKRNCPPQDNTPIDPQPLLAHSRNISNSSSTPSQLNSDQSVVRSPATNKQSNVTAILTMAPPLYPEAMPSTSTSTKVERRLSFNADVQRSFPNVGRGLIMAPISIGTTSSMSSSIQHISRGSDLDNNQLSASRSHLKQQHAPYRPGFQPKGVYRQLTDEFLILRRTKREEGGNSGRIKRIERTKLERRLEKLISLHFPLIDEGHGSAESAYTTVRPTITSSGREGRRASFFDFESFKTMKINGASDLWRGVMGSGNNIRQDIRVAQQRITPWEEDSSVNKCPLCGVSFHPLSNRKHHCRLCGKIICSLPPKPPQRQMTCSLLFVVDPKSRRIDEVVEGVDYGVTRRINSAADANQARHEEQAIFLKGVRICRDCRPIILRQQHQHQTEEIPVFVHLYDAFIDLEKDIEESLPQFQELILNLSHDDQPTKEASAARKRLLDAFVQYDMLSKQIRSLPCNGQRSSQDRVQMAVMTRATLFLQKNMFPLQSIPTPSSNKNSKANQQPDRASASGKADFDPDSDLALALQPLLEQESLLESFIEEAKAHRKFEDVKTLKINLEEIRKEIERHITSSKLRGTNVGIPKDSGL